MVLLENINVAAENSGGKEFKDDILPIINYSLESPTHSMVDAALRTLPIVLPILDFSTIKNELFPVIASIFAKTSSMGIKIRGLEAFRTLCGGGDEPDSYDGDGLTGMVETPKAKTNVSILEYVCFSKEILQLWVKQTNRFFTASTLYRKRWFPFFVRSRRRSLLLW